MGSLRTLYSEARISDSLTRSIRRLKQDYPLEFEAVLHKYRQNPVAAYFKMKLRL